jgi:3-oxoacyl-[acyl-carrier protein] reductase
LQIDLTDRVVIVTGAGRGIGEQVARRFGGERARLVLIDRNSDNLEKVDRALTADGARTLALTCDVTNERAVEEAVGAAIAKFGRVDALINNAGIAPEGAIDDMTLADWDATFATNTRGVFLCSRAVIPHMKRSQRGRILSASSFAAVIPSVGFAAYAASKSAVVTFTRVLAAELGPWGITANSYTPGMVPTPLNDYADAPPAKRDRLLNTLSLRRWGAADDIASLLIFLSSDHASYITGADIEITGGKYAVQFPQLAYERRR